MESRSERKALACFLFGRVTRLLDSSLQIPSAPNDFGQRLGDDVVGLGWQTAHWLHVRSIIHVNAQDASQLRTAQGAHAAMGPVHRSLNLLAAAHLGFGGGGVHFCLGAQVARHNSRIAVSRR
jgi:hypothetical protein